MRNECSLDATGREKNTLVFPGRTFDLLRQALLLGSPLESACFVLASCSDIGEGSRRLVVVAVIQLDESAYQERTAWSIQVAARALADATKRARTENLSLFVAHTHPTADLVLPSATDRAGERMWLPAISRRAPHKPHGRLIIGKSDVCAALLSPDGVEAPLRVIQLGDSIVECSSTDGADAINYSRHDRQVRAFGAEGQAQLTLLHVGVVGVGGTGSVVVEQLAHLGVGRMTLVDPDVLEESNLNRVVGASPSDVGSPKVVVATALVARVNEHCKVLPIQGDVRDVVIARHLLACDFIFCCTDTEGSRAIINQIAYQFCIPTIDLGVAIVVSASGVSHISGRVQLLSPTQPCLLCCRALDAEQVRRDLLTEEERAKDRYILGSSVAQPAVISINSATASLAVTMMLATVTAIPVASRHQRLRFESGVVSSVQVETNTACPICSPGGTLARGDTFAFPGRRQA